MGTEYFTDGSNVEELQAELRGERGGDPEAVRSQAEAAAREEVDRDNRWQAMPILAEQVVAEVATYRERIDQARENFKKEKFEEWYPAQKEELAGALREANAKFEEIAEGIVTAFPGQAIEMPVTSADAVNLNTRTRLLSEATPLQAARIVRDGIQRGDGPLLAAARTLLESWPQTREEWSGGDGARLATELLVEIEMTAPEVGRLKGEHAAVRLDEVRSSWRYLVNTLLKEDGLLASVHFETGALSPLLD